ncbi:hypothetical protein M1506_02315 [Patescibacteria group bacterium]|nr:hypothetical protein [Patescibacteria group bacterium]
MNELEKRIQAVEERNRRVEGDKAWEVSWTRRGLIMVFTYLALGVYMWAIGISNPWLNAIVPAVAFVLSTLTMPFFNEDIAPLAARYRNSSEALAKEKKVVAGEEGNLINFYPLFRPAARRFFSRLKYAIIISSEELIPQILIPERENG